VTKSAGKEPAGTGASTTEKVIADTQRMERGIIVTALHRKRSEKGPGSVASQAIRKIRTAESGATSRKERKKTRG